MKIGTKKIDVKKIDVRALAAEWLPMIIAVVLLILADICLKIMMNGPYDFRMPALAVPIIAGIIQFAKAKKPAMPLLVAAFIGGCTYMIP